jgi:hypothetical protein
VSLSSPPLMAAKLITKLTYFSGLFRLMLRRILNLVVLFERFDLLSELLPPLEDLPPLLLPRVYRPPPECSHEPLRAFLLVLEELRHIQLALSDQLRLLLTEYLAQLPRLLQDDVIVLQYLQAMFLVLRKCEPNRACLSLMKCKESLCVVILVLGLSGVPGCVPGCRRIGDDLEADSLVILIIALVKGVVWKALKTEAIEFVGFKAASVNASIR